MSIWKTKWGWRARVIVNKAIYPAPGYFQYKAEAKAWCKAEKERRKDQPQDSVTFALTALVEQYLDAVQVGQSHKTYEEKRGALERLLAGLGDVDPVTVTPAQIDALLVERARALSNNAANRDRKNYKTFFRWLQDFHGILHDPTGPTKRKPHTKKARRLIPIQDIFAVMMAAPMPERALIGACWHTGARRGEVLRWTWADDVNLEERWVRLGTRKTRGEGMHYERLWMNDDLHALLSEVWRKHRSQGSPYVFPDYYVPDARGLNPRGEQRAHRLLVGHVRQWRTMKGEARQSVVPGLCQRAGVEPFGFHDIRHTVAKYLNDIQKVGIKGVQQVLRHRRQTTTEIYLEGSYTGTRPALELLTQAEVEKLPNKTTPKVTPNQTKGAGQ